MRAGGVCVCVGGGGGVWVMVQQACSRVRPDSVSITVGCGAGVWTGPVPAAPRVPTCTHKTPGIMYVDMVCLGHHIHFSKDMS